MSTILCDHLSSDPCVTSCEPQGIHSCSDCGKRFVKAQDWMAHTSGMCPVLMLEARDKHERNRRRLEKQKREAFLRESIRQVVDEDGYSTLMEIVACELAEYETGDDTWTMRSREVLSISEVGV